MDITTQKKKRLLKLAEIENGGKFAITENIIKLEEKNEEVDSKLGQIIEEITIPVNQTITFKDTEVITIRGKDGRDGKDGEKGDKGEQGIQGEKGDRGEDGINGRDGKDGENGQDGKDGIDGKDGENGKDGSPDTGEEIVVKINDLSIESDDFKIDASHIKNLPEVTKEIVGGVVSRNLYQLGDVSLTDLSNGQTLVYNSTTHLWENGAGGVGAGTWGSITGTLSNQTDLQTALDAKLDGNGVATYIPFYSDANTLTSEAHLNYDSVNHRLHVHAIAGDATDGLLIESDNGTDIGILGAANTANVTWYGNHNFNTATQDTIAGFTGAGKTLGSLATATYPSLTELSYVKGVTSAIQTQLNSKGDVTADDTSTTAQNIVAYSGAGGKNITELTGTQGDILYHNGTSWVKLGAGTVGYVLTTGGAGANPSWGTGYVHVSTSSSATTTGANTNPVDVSGAVFTYVANAIYRIWVMGRINSTAATTGIGLHFNFSTAITDINVHTIHPLATSTTATAYSISDDASEGVSTGVPAGPLDVPFRSEALFRPGNNTGTCQLRFRAEVAAVTELLAGVTMIVERIA